MTSSIKNGGYAFLIRLDLILEKSCTGWFLICLKCEILIIDTWNEYIKKSDGMVNLFFYSEFNVRIPIA